MSALSQEDHQKLRELKDQPNHHQRIEYDEDAPLETPWRLNDGRATVTLEQCNAVRCAAEDGLSYTRIAEIFGFLSCKTHAHRHATGLCSHDGDVPPTSNGRLPGPEAGSVTPAECAELRRKWRRGYFDTYRDAGRWLGRAESAAWRHINDDCSHD